MNKWVLGAAAYMAFTCWGCSDKKVITCDPANHGSECVQGGISGECAATCDGDDAAHYCAFPAPVDCPESGLEFGVLSGDESQKCVATCEGPGDASVADGGSVDAADAAPSCTPRIAYGTGRDAVDFASNIFTMNIDGSDQKRVNTSDGLYQSPIWSPDGRTLLMFCNFGLCSLPAAGGPAVTLTQIGGDFESGGSWTPDSQRIVYADAEESPSTKSYIWIMNADSSGKQRLTSSGADGQPRVSPDGTKISFVSTRDGNAEIYTMNLDGTAQTNLSHHVGNDGVDNITAGLWSPDGSQLLFVSDGDPNIDEDIFVVPAAGGTVRPVANVDANDSAPAWSPDGAKIAWVHGSGIRVMNADGSAQVEVTDGSSEDSAPVWIDATHLVFVRYSGQNEGADDIFSAEAKANATVTRLTNDPHGDIAPAFTACARP